MKENLLELHHRWCWNLESGHWHLSLHTYASLSSQPVFLQIQTHVKMSNTTCREEWNSVKENPTNFLCFPFQHCCLVCNTNFYEIYIWIETLRNSKFEFLQEKQDNLSWSRWKTFSISANSWRQKSYKLHLHKCLPSWTGTIKLTTKNIITNICSLHGIKNLNG